MEESEMDEEKLLSLDQRHLECEIATLGERMEEMTPNMAAIEGYRRKEEQHKERLSEFDRVTSQRDEARNKFNELREERLEKFLEGFTVITSTLKQMYQVCLCAGDGHVMSHGAIVNLLHPASSQCDVGPVCVPIELLSTYFNLPQSNEVLVQCVPL